ncbi:ABC transporter ATP-binding protein [Xanthomonadaceae bacterium XH05]|nr:ABC transporter ATP-binding protein [Xanthomonadaceae bacterium XH05]
MSLQLEQLRIGYPAATGVQIVVDGLSLALARGEIGCLLGASGCGKTTVLRAIAGFEPLHAGRITLDGVDVAGPEEHWPPERRHVGMVFQDYALFPHLSVAGNVGFGLRGMARAERDARVHGILERIGLEALAGRYPHELSGGQQQRVALARALAPAPSVLLLDEPFSNLDIHTRGRLASEVRDLLKASDITALLVTHDQAEAFAVADRIGVMDRGRILQWSDAPGLYHTPQDRFVAGFIGRGTLVPATVLGLEGEGDVLVRPEHLRCDATGPIRARLIERAFHGPETRAVMALPSGERVEVDLPAGVPVATGDEITFSYCGDARQRFPRDASTR